MQRTTFPAGAPAWLDMSSSDPGRAKDFYGGLLGWGFVESGEEYGRYVIATVDGRQVAGLMEHAPGYGTADVWSVYLAAPDADAVVARAQALGATVLVPPMDVVDLGRFAFFTDPFGASVGVWQGGALSGFEVEHETGAPTWFELHVRDFTAARDFYADVFGWNPVLLSDTDEFRYVRHEVDGLGEAGIMDASAYLPEGVDGMWTVYFRVDDVVRSLEQVASLGGSIVSGPEETPYGQLAEVCDPNGGAVKLVSGGPAMF